MRYFFAGVILLCLLPFLDYEYGWTYRTTLAGLLIAAALFVALANVMGLVEVYRDHRHGSTRGYSMVPLISAFLTICAYFVYPGESKWWILLILPLDLANWGLLYLPIFLLRRRWKK